MMHWTDELLFLSFWYHLSIPRYLLFASLSLFSLSPSLILLCIISYWILYRWMWTMAGSTRSATQVSLLTSPLVSPLLSLFVLLPSFVLPLFSLSCSPYSTDEETWNVLCWWGTSSHLSFYSLPIPSPSPHVPRGTSPRRYPRNDLCTFER